MKITNINIPAERTLKGLKAIKMDRLGKIVVLAGANGSGKTRMLNQIDHFKNVNIYRDLIEVEGGEINDLRFHDWVPKQAIIQNTNNMMMDERDNYLNDTNIRADQKKSINNYSTKAVILLEEICKNYISANAHADGIQISTEKRSEHIEKFASLKKQIDSLFPDANFGVGVFKPLMYGKSIQDVGLSEGQAILLQYIVALWEQGGDIATDILIMDEPENHLHPEALINLIKQISDANTDGQIWIATHNVPLIAYCAHMDPYSVWYASEGYISRSYKNTYSVLNSLFGGEDNLAVLEDYIQEPGRFEANHFAWECMFAPKVLDTDAEDPQGWQIRDVLKELLGLEGEVLKVLDFGAGKGRILSNIIDNEGVEFVNSSLDYVAYDLFLDDKEDCIDNILSVYESKDDRYYNSSEELIKDHSEAFDVIVLTNVFHEIDPKYWMELFAEGETFDQLLKPKGKILIVEDQLLPVGEKAHDFGFFLFDEPEFKILFHDQSVPMTTESHHKNNRLKRHLIDRKSVISISTGTIKASVNNLSNRSIEELKQLDKVNRDYKTGRQRAFWLEQFANCHLFLGESS